jgi:Fic family protein
LEIVLAYVHPAPQLDDLVVSLSRDDFFEALKQRYGAESRGIREWVHWDKLRHLDPPERLSHEQWWLGIKMARRSLLRPFPLRDAQTGEPFSFATPDEVLRLLHDVDRHCAGEIAMPEVVVSDEQARRHYLVNSIMEEAIRSSQLEGATTSRRRAVELLRSGRPPSDRSERMIINNYRALEFIRSAGDRLTPSLVLELHRILTEGTLDDPDAAGRLQRPDEDRVAVYDVTDGSLVHRPPPAEELPERLDALCAFANGEEDTAPFIHPVVRAILVHLWLAYDHPFEDGNGRTARALFYWSMRQGRYWLTEYLSISRILRHAPAKYSNAFVLTETDGGDATYFVIYQLEVINRAVSELHGYLRRKVREIQALERRIKAAGELNHRQLALVGDALRTPGRRYTYASHATSHGVTHETARSDIMRLAELGFLDRAAGGRRHVYVAAPGLPERLQGAAAS